MAGIKGVGAGAVEIIIKERERNGPFKDIYDFVERLPLTTVNKKNLEALAYAGGLDNLGGFHRAQLFAPLNNEDSSFIENLIRYGNKFQADKVSQEASLFGAIANEIAIKKPELPNCEPFSRLEELNKEKDSIGLYLSAHPLDDFKMELKYFTNTKLKDLENLEAIEGKEVIVAGMVTHIKEGLTKTQKQYGIMTLEDYSGSFEFPFFGKDYDAFSQKLRKELFLRIRGKVQRKTWKRQNETEFQIEVKVNHITDLADIKEDNINEIKLKTPLSSITPEFVKALYNLPKTEKGMAVLRLLVYDKELNMQVQVLSRSVKVALTHELENFIEEYPHVTMQIK